jgi:hypothetical protein
LSVFARWTLDGYAIFAGRQLDLFIIADLIIFLVRVGKGVGDICPSNKFSLGSDCVRSQLRARKGMAVYVLDWQQLVIDLENTSRESIEVAFNFNSKYHLIPVAQFLRFMLSQL